MKKALEEDSTVYDYDAVYDDIQKQRLETSKKVLSGPAKKPKYIHQLMKAVDSRKKEQERREERKIQKEREAEGNQFADKEAYVTTAYKLKLQEQKEEEERAKHEAAIEAALDVRKQNDLSGFYRHLLNQTVGEEAIPDRSANKSLKSEDGGILETSQTSHEITPTDGEPHEEKHSKSSSSHSKRHYRRRSPASGSDDERERKKEPEKDEQRSGRRDRDKDGQSHRRRDEPREKGDRRKSEEDKGREEEVQGKDKGEAAGEEKDEGEKEEGEKEGQTEETKVNKFAKRSNEQTLSSARDRYLARQMARSTSKSYIEREED
ncbi:nuclear speckle splicing regulatory protein 1 isoform 2-T2 [Syngnathus typhle]